MTLNQTQRNILNQLEEGPKSLKELDQELDVTEQAINNQRKRLHEQEKIQPTYVEGSKKWELIPENTELPHPTEKEIKQLTDFLRENDILKKKGNNKKLEINTEKLREIKNHIQEQNFDSIGDGLKDINLDKDGIPQKDLVSVLMEISQILANVKNPKYNLDEKGISVRFKGDITSLFATPELEEFKKELSLHRELQKDDLGRYKEVEEPVECDDCGEEISEGETLYSVRDRDFNISKEICESCRKKDHIVDGLNPDTKQRDPV